MTNAPLTFWVQFSWLLPLSGSIEDTRKLSTQAQQALRQRAVAAVVDGERSQGELAQEFGVTRTAVNQWVQPYPR